MDFNFFINSAIGTTIAELVVSPVCLVKTNFQNNNLNTKNTIKHIYNNYGIRGFYSATLIATCTQVFSTSSKYFVYRNLCEYNNYNKVLNNIVGCLGVSLITHPLDFIKVNTQMHVNKMINKIIENPIILYRGYSKTFLKTVISAPLFFPLKDEIDKHVSNPIFGSIIASTIGTIVMQPFDYLKNRHLYGNSLYNKPGISIYYKGLSLNLLRVVPHFTICMYVTNYLNKL